MRVRELLIVARADKLSSYLCGQHLEGARRQRASVAVDCRERVRLSMLAFSQTSRDAMSSRMLSLVAVVFTACGAPSASSDVGSAAGSDASSVRDASLPADGATGLDATPAMDSGGVDCAADAAICPPGTACQVYCGNGWCSGVCVQRPSPDAGSTLDSGLDCASDAAICPPGTACQVHCGNGWCSGVCVQEPKPDAGTELDSGFDCASDAAICAPGTACQVYCGNGWCSGVCVSTPDGGPPLPAACSAAGGVFCTRMPGEQCPGGSEVAGGADPSLGCSGGWCCVPAPASPCSSAGMGTCIPNTCGGCYRPLTTPDGGVLDCEQGRVCCINICD
jgi:hypothetical protein